MNKRHLDIPVRLEAKGSDRKGECTGGTGVAASITKMAKSRNTSAVRLSDSRR
jgi:hypothetical protein